MTQPHLTIPARRAKSPKTKILLTDRGLKAMKAAAIGTRPTVWDAAVPNFGVRISDKGKLTFIVMRRLGGKMARRTVGQYPITTLAAAREAALAALRDIEQGVDPYEKKASQRRAEAARNANSFAVVAEEFIARHVSKLRSARPGEATIRRELMPAFGLKPIADITRRDVMALIERIADSGRPYAAHKVFAYITRFFAWCLARGSRRRRAPRSGQTRLSARRLRGNES